MKKFFTMFLLVFLMIFCASTSYSTEYLTLTKEKGTFNKYVWQKLKLTDEYFSDISGFYHNKLHNLSYEKSGHTGFVSDSGDSLTGNYSLTGGTLSLTKQYTGTASMDTILKLEGQYSPSSDSAKGMYGLGIQLTSSGDKEVGEMTSQTIKTYHSGTDILGLSTGLFLDTRMTTEQSAITDLYGINNYVRYWGNRNDSYDYNTEHIHGIRSLLDLDAVYGSTNVDAGKGNRAAFWGRIDFKDRCTDAAVGYDTWWPDLAVYHAEIFIEEDEPNKDLISDHHNICYQARIRALRDDVNDPIKSSVKNIGFRSYFDVDDYGVPYNNYTQSIGIWSDMWDHPTYQLRNVSGWFTGAPLIVGRFCETYLNSYDKFRSNISDDGDFGCTGDAEINGDLRADAKLNVTGTTFLNSTLEVEDNCYFAASLQVGESAEFQDTVEVDGTLTNSGWLQQNGQAHFESGVFVNDYMEAADLTAESITIEQYSNTSAGKVFVLEEDFTYNGISYIWENFANFPSDKFIIYDIRLMLKESPRLLIADEEGVIEVILWVCDGDCQTGGSGDELLYTFSGHGAYTWLRSAASSSGTHYTRLDTSASTYKSYFSNGARVSVHDTSNNDNWVWTTVATTSSSDPLVPSISFQSDLGDEFNTGDYIWTCGNLLDGYYGEGWGSRSGPIYVDLSSAGTFSLKIETALGIPVDPDIDASLVFTGMIVEQ